MRSPTVPGRAGCPLRFRHLAGCGHFPEGSRDADGRRRESGNCPTLWQLEGWTAVGSRREHEIGLDVVKLLSAAAR